MNMRKDFPQLVLCLCNVQNNNTQIKNLIGEILAYWILLLVELVKMTCTTYYRVDGISNLLKDIEPHVILL